MKIRDLHNKHKRERIRQEYSAGGVVFKRTSTGPKIAFILDPYKKWGFAKGHIKKGETPRAAALRETREEMGLSKLRATRYLGMVDFWFRDRFVHKGALIYKKVYYYLMETSEGVKAHPQKKEKIYRVRWVDARDALRVLSYTNSVPILTRALRYLRVKKQRSSM